MANGRKISQFPFAAGINNADVVGGVQNGVSTKFSFSTILLWLKSVLVPSDIGAVPTTRTVNGKALSNNISLNASDVGAQDEITASGMLKGDGLGGVSAATPGTDYGTYSKPSGGIPSTDMTSAVQTSLGKADTAYQKPSGGIPASDLASGVIPTVPSAYTSNPAMDGTASPGSTGEWADGGHIHPSDTSKANQSQLATVETGNTASVDHEMNTYFCWNGLLYRATAKISTGQSFTPGTNCEPVTAGGELFDRCRMMTVSVEIGKSVDIVITGNNYTPFHGFILISTGNQISRMMGAWLCFGLGTRYNYHVIQPLHTSGATSLSLTSTVDGKYTFTNNDLTYGCVITVAVLQEKGTGTSYLSLSEPY